MIDYLNILIEREKEELLKSSNLSEDEIDKLSKERVLDQFDYLLDYKITIGEKLWSKV